MRRMSICILILILGLLCPAPATSTVVHQTNPTTSWPELRPDRIPLVNQMAKGFVKMIAFEAPRWYSCGVAIPRDKWLEHATHIVTEVVSSMDFYRLNGVSRWGGVALAYKESRGNPCTPGPHPRKYAKKQGLVAQDKTVNQWTKEDTIRVLLHKNWRGRSADLGIGQDVWKKWSRVCDQEYCTQYQHRVPSIHEMLSIDGSARVMAWGMKTRQRSYHRQWWATPWVFWRGSQPRPGYARALARIVRDMGGPWQEVLSWKN